jgi:biopolymer transport protein ExbB
MAVACLIGCTPPLAAQDLEALASTARQDLRVALDELAALRSQIEAERIPLGQRLSALEQSVLDQRAALQRAQREEGNQMVLLGVLRSEVNGFSNEVRSLESLLSEYRRTFEGRLHISEQQRYREATQRAAAAAEAVDFSPAQKLKGQLEFVEVTLKRLEDAVAGDRFPGRALTPAGIVEQGTFLMVGPAAYFSSSAGTAAGVVEQRLNSPEPNVAPLSSAAQTTGLRALIANGSGDFSLDPTSGTALRIRATRDSLAAHIGKGGPVMVPILALGAFALIIFAVKWFQVARVRVATPPDLKLILTSLGLGHREKAIEHARTITGPVGDMLAMALQHIGEPKEYVEEVMYEKMLDTKPRLERLVPFLALAAAAAPLLGLLGTVTGMINTFNMITVFGTGDPKTLAGGISEALITTEFGLVVAIPSLLLHAVIARKVKGVLASMEQTTVAFINGLPDSPAEPADNSNPPHDYDRSHS